MRLLILAAVAMAAVALPADAGPFRRSVYRSSATCSAGPGGSSCTVRESYRGAAPACADGKCDAAAGDGADALAEVNAKRAARGLPPYLPDPALTAGAKAAAAARAARGLFGHTANDFAFLPPGATAAAAGCAAYPDAYGWMSCAVYDRYTYAGAAWVRGADGRRFMHLFVR